MSVNLTIDRGNSLTKLAAWGRDGLLAAEAFASSDLPSMLDFISEFEIGFALISSVAGELPGLTEALIERGIPVRNLSPYTPLPVTLGYTTPATLGLDRIAAVVGAYALIPARDILVIDAGTAITYDRLTSDGCFAGGNIAPGVEMRLKALHQFTRRLPEVNPSDATPTEWGTDTSQAMINGAFNGILAETLYYRSLLPPASAIVITGGDGQLLASRIEFRVFYEPHLVTLGLNAIINYNNFNPSLS